jgi:hypothetical protein
MALLRGRSESFGGSTGNKTVGDFAAGGLETGIGRLRNGA